MSILTYSEMVELPTFEERFDYLSLKGSVGHETFGFERQLNQSFYTSREWRDVRDFVIVRDNGSDLAAEGYEIYNRILIHHMNPITPLDIKNRNPAILDPEFLITTNHETHNAIHYGRSSSTIRAFTERKPGDTRLW